MRASTVYVIFKHSPPSSSTFAGKGTIFLNAHMAVKTWAQWCCSAAITCRGTLLSAACMLSYEEACPLYTYSSSLGVPRAFVSTACACLSIESNTALHVWSKEPQQMKACWSSR